MKYLRYLGFAAVLITAGCGMFGPTGPTFEEVFKANKGLMDSVRMSFKNIEKALTDSAYEITDMIKAEKLPVPLEYDGSDNNNMEIIPVAQLSNPDDASGFFTGGELFTALDWTGSNSTMSLETMKEEAGDYAINVFKKVREKSRYLAVYRYVQYDAPMFTTPSEFEVGYVDMEVLLYDLKTAGMLGAFRFVAESDSLINYEYDTGASDQTQMYEGTAAAVKELEEKCKWMIIKGLQEISSTKLKVYVTEREGPYFVTGGSEREEIVREREKDR